MNRQDRMPLITLVLLISIIVIVAGCVTVSDQKKEMRVNASQAVEIIKLNGSAEQYYSEHYKHPEWRGERAILINDTSMTEDCVHEELPYWQVEIMERTCACSGIKNLYVIEGHVSPFTGEITNLTTGQVLESTYDNTTCTTKCH